MKEKKAKRARENQEKESCSETIATDECLCD
jgi:hypothetical protein